MLTLIKEKVKQRRAKDLVLSPCESHVLTVVIQFLLLTFGRAFQAFRLIGLIGVSIGVGNDVVVGNVIHSM